MSTRKILLQILLAASVTAAVFVTARAEPGLRETDYVPGEILVKFKEGSDEWSQDWVRGRVNGLVARRYRNVGIEKLLISRGQSVEEACRILENDPLVRFAEPNRYVKFLGMPYAAPNDPGFTSGDQWHLSAPSFSDIFIPPDTFISVDADLDAPEAWGVMESIFDSGMTTAVGVLDSGCGQAGYFSEVTGYVPGHADLPNSVLFANTAELSLIGSDSPADLNDLIDDVNGWDWVGNDNVPADNDSDPFTGAPYHGTRISGIIAARWNNGAAVAGIGKDHLKILPLRIEDVADVIAGIDYAIEMSSSGKPVRVLNASWSTTFYSSSLKQAIEQAGAAGIALSASAGNRGLDNDDSLASAYPAEYTKIPLTNVLAVAATGPDGALAEFSNYGPFSVQIAAPGENIYSTAGGAGGYTSRSGTSFSAPIAGAALGLILAAHPDMSPEQAIDRLVNGGDFDPRLAGQVSSGKRVNLAGALAPFYPFSGLAPLDGSVMPISIYTDSISASFGSISQADSSDDSVAVMVTDPSGSWMVSPIAPGVASFTLFFDGVDAPLGSYETGPWRATAISPFSAVLRAGEVAEEPFTNLLPGSVSWSVMDPAIGTVDENGWFTGSRTGLTRVVLSIDGTPMDSSGTVRVLAPYSSSGGSNPCFIATAAYGSPVEPHVRILREFRDRYLITGVAGRAFVTAYYRYSPPLANLVASNGLFRWMARTALFPIVALCYGMVRFGPLSTMAVISVLLAIPAVILIRRCMNYLSCPVSK